MTEQTINFERMEYALTLFGNSDENIRMLEQGYGVSVVFRGPISRSAVMPKR